METYYAIEVMGYGDGRRYLIREITTSKKGWPTARGIDRPFRTLAEAARVAGEYGFDIKVVGDLYQIM